MLFAKVAHLKLLHAGPQHTLATIRDRFSIVMRKACIKWVVRRCRACFKFKARLTRPIMTCLAGPHNSRQSFEFEVDYAGPVVIKCKSGKDLHKI